MRLMRLIHGLSEELTLNFFANFLHLNRAHVENCVLFYANIYIMDWDGAERGLSSSVAGKGEDLFGGRELVL